MENSIPPNNNSPPPPPVNSNTTPAFNPSNPQHINQMFEMMRTQIATLTDELHQARSQEPSPASPLNKEPKVALPEKFNGNRKQLREFLASVRNIFRLKPSTYDTDDKKIGLVGSLLLGNALTWYRILEESKNPTPLRNYDEFIKNLSSHFGDPNRKRNAQREIKSLKQNKSSALTYTTKFIELAMDAEFDEEAKLYTYYEGLNEDIKDVLSTMIDFPDDFEKLHLMAIRIDNRLYERAQDKKRTDNRTNSARKPHHQEPRPPVRIPMANSSTPHPRPPSNKDSRSYAPMDIDTTKKFKPLSQEEKNRRKANHLCLYCGQPNHVALYCPEKSKRKSFRRVQVDMMTPSNPSTTLPVHEVNSPKNDNES